jgi:GTP-binding protein
LELLCPISAEHNIGTGGLEETILSKLPPPQEAVSSPEKRERTSIAFLGRPNVGKSSLVNALLREPRMAVSDVPGTTRDVVDTVLKGDAHDFVLLDTAGMRKKSRVVDDVEHVSVVKTLRAIERANVAVLVLDGSEPMTTQDKQIAAAAAERGCGLMVCVNKWDLQKDFPENRRKVREELYSVAPFLQFAAVRFISAKTGLGVDGILSSALRIQRAKTRSFTSQELRDAFDQISTAHVPAGKKGRPFRLIGLAHSTEKISTFFVWCNDPRQAPQDLERYWEKALGEVFELEGVPLRVIFRRRAKK